jgi:hypothetical protein
MMKPPGLHCICFPETGRDMRIAFGALEAGAEAGEGVTENVTVAMGVAGMGAWGVGYVQAHVMESLEYSGDCLRSIIMILIAIKITINSAGRKSLIYARIAYRIDR